MSADMAHIVAPILGGVAVVVLIGAVIGFRMFGRQLNPPEFTGDQGFDGEGRP